MIAGCRGDGFSKAGVVPVLVAQRVPAKSHESWDWIRLAAMRPSCARLGRPGGLPYGGLAGPVADAAVPAVAGREGRVTGSGNPWTARRLGTCPSPAYR